MLFDNVSPPLRRVTVQQQHLIFLDIPSPHEAVWTQLDNQQRAAAIDLLARLMTQIDLPDVSMEENHDE